MGNSPEGGIRNSQRTREIQHGRIHHQSAAHVGTKAKVTLRPRSYRGVSSLRDESPVTFGIYYGAALRGVNPSCLGHPLGKLLSNYDL